MASYAAACKRTQELIPRVLVSKEIHAATGIESLHNYLSYKVQQLHGAKHIHSGEQLDSMQCISLSPHSCAFAMSCLFDRLVIVGKRLIN